MMARESPTGGPVDLADLTTLRVGGPAARYVAARSDADLIAAIAEADDTGEPVLIVGGGSNLLVGDDGFDGLVVQVHTRGIDEADECGAARVTVQAGEPWDAFVATMVERGYAGVEALAGIPGSVGATPIQNVGAYGQEVADVVESVRVWDRTTREASDLARDDCDFGYRTSRFKAEPGRFVVLSVVMQLSRSALSRPVRYSELARGLGVGIGDRASLPAVRDEVLRLRGSKGMVLDDADHDTWSAGSFFTNPIVAESVAAALPQDAPAFPTPDGRVKVSAAWLIGFSGFERGWGDGPATLSTKHTLALTNRGSATAADVVALARTVRDRVRERTGITLVPEPTLINCSI